MELNYFKQKSFTELKEYIKTSNFKNIALQFDYMSNGKILFIINFFTFIFI